MIFTETSTRRVLTPWGAEVKKRLIDRSLRQDDLVTYLNFKGYEIKKAHLTNLLYGIGTSVRKEEIKEICEYLDIKYSE